MKNISLHAAVYLILAAMAALVLPASSLAVMASPEPFTVTQPDGAKFEAVKKGDERLNWTETVEGYTVVKDMETGVWEYAITSGRGELIPSGIAVAPGVGPPAGLPKHIKPPARQDPEKMHQGGYGPVY
ncbi:MAG TPA: hypothetical protein VGB23_07435 [Nitrospirota bacterium]